MEKSASSTRAWGVASLVLGIASLLFVWLPFLGVVFAVLAVVFYGVQRRHGSTGLATAGLVTGIIGIVLNGILLFLVLLGVLAFLGMSDRESFESSDFIMTGGFRAGEYRVAGTEGVQLEVINALGADATAVNVTLRTWRSVSPTCHESVLVPGGLASGQSTGMLTFCGENEYSPNDRFQADVIVTYVRSGQVSSRTASGAITTRVAPG